MPRPIDRAQVAANLHVYANKIAAGIAPVPAMRRDTVDGHPLRIVPTELHDVLCAWRIASPQETDPVVLHCHGCGLCYPRPDTTGEPYCTPIAGLVDAYRVRNTAGREALVHRAGNGWQVTYPTAGTPELLTVVPAHYSLTDAARWAADALDRVDDTAPAIRSDESIGQPDTIGTHPEALPAAGSDTAETRASEPRTWRVGDPEPPMHVERVRDANGYDWLRLATGSPWWRSAHTDSTRRWDALLGRLGPVRELAADLVEQVRDAVLLDDDGTGVAQYEPGPWRPADPGER